MYEAKEALAGFVIAGGDSAETFESMEEQLDEVAFGIEVAPLG